MNMALASYLPTFLGLLKGPGTVSTVPRVRIAKGIQSVDRRLPARPPGASSRAPRRRARSVGRARWRRGLAGKACVFVPARRYRRRAAPLSGMFPWDYPPRCNYSWNHRKKSVTASFVSHIDPARPISSGCQITHEMCL